MSCTKYLSIFVALLLSSCSSKVFEPLYDTAPTIPLTPTFSYLPERVVPSVERKQLSFTLFQEKSPGENDFYNNPDVKLLKSSPSVIIGVPEEANRKEKTALTNEAEVYKTDGYYNEAEQAIEGALLRKGFNVLDRSKFEAKLRDLRDRANDNRYYWWSNYDKLIENKEYDVVKSILEEEVKSGKISQDQYIERIGEIDNLSQIGLPGQKRTEDEMNDIAEVIRAAQTGEDQADYLLQINKVAIADAGNQRLSFQDKPEVKKFMNENPGLRFGSLPNSLPASISSQWLRVDFNAKLIGINTGSIVWLGSYGLESWAAQPIRIVFDVQRSVDNDEIINSAIRSYNMSLKNANEKLENTNLKLMEVYQKATTQRKFDKSDEVTAYKIELLSTIESLQKDHNSNSKSLQVKIEDKPKEFEMAWSYSYLVSDPNVQPNLLIDGMSSIAGKQKLLNHRKELIREVTQQLIKTIQLK